jgi:hypothetical protein
MSGKINEGAWLEFIRHINRDGLLLMVMSGITRERVKEIVEWRKFVRIELDDGTRVDLWKRGWK